MQNRSGREVMEDHTQRGAAPQGQLGNLPRPPTSLACEGPLNNVSISPSLSGVLALTAAVSHVSLLF